MVGGDFDGDGDVDVIVISLGIGEVMLFDNCEGLLEYDVLVIVLEIFWVAVILDYDGDGDFDVVVVDYFGYCVSIL